MTKRIVELMGEDEESFVGFIMGQVSGKNYVLRLCVVMCRCHVIQAWSPFHVQISDKSSASEMIAALKDVLDEDTLNFVVKLFQV